MGSCRRGACEGEAAAEAHEVDIHPGKQAENIKELTMKGKALLYRWGSKEPGAQTELCTARLRSVPSRQSELGRTKAKGVTSACSCLHPAHSTRRKASEVR